MGEVVGVETEPLVVGEPFPEIAVVYLFIAVFIIDLSLVYRVEVRLFLEKLQYGQDALDDCGFPGIVPSDEYGYRSEGQRVQLFVAAEIVKAYTSHDRSVGCMQIYETISASTTTIC